MGHYSSLSWTAGWFGALEMRVPVVQLGSLAHVGLLDGMKGMKARGQEGRPPMPGRCLFGGGCRWHLN